MNVRSRRYGPVVRKKTGFFKRLLAQLRRWSGRKKPTKTSAVAQVQASQLPRRLLRFSLLALVLVCCGAAVAVGGWRLLTGSDIFTLARISVEGNRTVSDQQVMDQAGLERGMNLFRINSGRLQQKIVEHPWIREATVQIRWPSEVVVTVSEHQPLAIVATAGDGALSYLDSHGEVFAPVAPGQDMNYPVLSGALSQLGLEKGAIVPGSPVADALQFLQLAARGNAQLPIQDVSEVHVSAEHGVVVYLVEHPFPIYLGEDQIRDRYYRLVKMLERLYRKEQIEQISSIRMDYGEDKALVAGLKQEQ